MAFGTVPLITDDVSIEDYYDPPLEHVHYIKVSTPDELESKIASISPEKWQEMSNSCTTWYMRNIHSSNTWNIYFICHIWIRILIHKYFLIWQLHKMR